MTSLCVSSNKECTSGSGKRSTLIVYGKTHLPKQKGNEIAGMTAKRESRTEAGNRRSAAGGGYSEAVSRKHPDWRAVQARESARCDGGLKQRFGYFAAEGKVTRSAERNLFADRAEARNILSGPQAEKIFQNPVTKRPHSASMRQNGRRR